VVRHAVVILIYLYFAAQNLDAVLQVYLVLFFDQNWSFTSSNKVFRIFYL